MAIEQELGRRAVLFAGAALSVAWVSAGCTDDEEDNPVLPSVRYADAELEKGFHKWWAWIPLVALLAGACDGCKAPGPRELVCKPIAYYELLNSEQGACKAPFNIERLGPELKSEQVRRKPDVLAFPRKDRVAVVWDMGGDFIPGTEFIYSPVEGLVREIDYPDEVYPIKLFSDSKPERVRFGFRSTVCRKPSEDGSYRDCKPTEGQLFLVADMTCTWELYDPDEELE